MIQKGIVKSLALEKNILYVRIPIFETAGSQEAIFECRLCTEPGILNGYNVGDVVFVSFESNYLNLPVVIGKLYKGLKNMNNSNTSIFAESLNINGKTVLSPDFNVGNISYNDLISFKKAIADLQNRVSTIEKQLENSTIVELN